MIKISIDNEKFKDNVSFVVSNNNQKNIIGRLSEKILHSTIKYYLAEEKYHEKKVGSFYADILIDGRVYEIQNGNFNKLREKLKYYLENEIDVTIIYPIIHKKKIYWLNENNELSDGRLSNKKGSFYKVFPELYKIKNYLNNPKLHFIFMLINVDEYKMLNGWDETKKKGSSRIDRIPKIIEDILIIDSIKDYSFYTSIFKDCSFKTKDFQKVYKTNLKEATIALNVLYHLGVIKRVGKEGNSYLYQNI